MAFRVARVRPGCEALRSNMGLTPEVQKRIRRKSCGVKKFSRREHFVRAAME
jgi:hypothetical protein